MSTEDHELPDLTKVPVDDRDRVWFEHYYQGDSMPQLTVRAVVMGMALGTLLSLTNLYIGLKTGWGLGVAITACIMSYAIWTVLLKIGIAKTPMSVLENNCMQSTASSAGYSTGGTMVSCIGAYVIVTQHQMPFGVLFCWTAFLAMLGVAVAIPMKRQMINHDQLPFPSGIAAAETLRSLHASGDEALLKARALFISLFAGGIINFLVGGTDWFADRFKQDWLKSFTVPGAWDLPFKLNGKDASKFGLSLPIDPLMMAAGAIVGMRTSISIAVGSVLLYGIIGPWLDRAGILSDMHTLGAIKTADVTQGNIRAWGLWAGSAMMVTAGLTSFGFSWKSIARALGGLGGLFGGGDKRAAEDPLAAIEVPNSWFAAGTAVSGLGCIVIMQIEWDVPWYKGILAVVFAFVLSLIACRATGETDTTPIGAMGKVTQLAYGILIPQNMIANLMTAGVTAGAASSSADLLTDLKSGYLLGANPRQQTLAQAYGIIAGTFATTFAWCYLFVRTPDALQSDKFPAPAATVWASVAQLLSKGLESMHPTIIVGMAIGGVLGVLITVGERLLPENVAKWLPSPTGLGLAFVIYFTDSTAFLIGATVAWLFNKFNPKAADTYVVPVAAGIIAGESLMGAALVGAQVVDGITSGG